MKTVGRRQARPVHLRAAGERLAEGARFSEAISGLSRIGIVPKGVRRFKTHRAANRHWDTCLAQAMAALAATRRR